MKTELALLMLYEKPVLSREQVAELMGVKRETMSNMLSAESVPIPMLKVGPRWCAHISCKCAAPAAVITFFRILRYETRFLYRPIGPSMPFTLSALLRSLIRFRSKP